MNKAIINDDSGRLAEIARLAEQPNPAEHEVEIEGANIKGSMQEAVQEALNDSSQDADEQETPPANETPAQKLERETEEARLAEEERKARNESESDEEKAQREQQEAETKELDKKLEERLDQHPRFQELNSKVKELTPLAENARLDAQYCQQWNIPPEQKKTAMELCALLNTDPKKAREALAQIIQNIDLQTGAALPPDLQKEVTDGTMSKERATELHLARLAVENSKRSQTQTQEQQVKGLQNGMREAQNQWGNLKMKSDPDFKPKADAGKPDGVFEMTVDKMKLLALEKPPTTVADAVQIADTAYTWAKGIAKRFTPTPRARRIPTGDIRSSEPITGDPKPGETMAQFVSRTAGRKNGFTVSEVA